MACVFSQGKRPAGNQIHADLYCKPEGLSPDGGLSYPTSTKPHQTREPRGLLPSGGKPAVKLLSSERSARIARSPGSRGTAPCASREACRRAAVKPRPTGISPYAPARTARSPGSRGTAPCASREACCRAAVNLRPSCFPPSALRAQRVVRGQGALPLARSPKGAQPPCKRVFGSLPSRRTARK